MVTDISDNIFVTVL